MHPTGPARGYHGSDVVAIGSCVVSEEHQRADYSPNSPTLSDNQTLLSRPVGSGGMPGGNSPFQAYLPVQQQSYSPHQSSSHIPTQDRQDYRVDPYRSAYSQHQHHQQQFQQMQQQGSFSPYHGTSVPLEDSYNSRHSLSSSNGASMAGGQRYPMRTLHSHDSNQHSQGGATPASSEFGGGRSDRYQDLEDGSLIGTTNRQSSAMQHQYSLADSNPGAGHRVKDGEREDENAEILTSDKKSKNKKTNKFISVEDDEEEGQERGEMRYRDSKRCWCCSRRQCVYMTFVLLICLAIALYFVIPRPPVFAFISVTSMGDPVITAGEVQEPFSIQMQVDSSSNYVPLRINSVEMSMWMKIDMTNIGNNNGLSSSFTIKPRTIQSVSLPMVMDYTSLMIDTNADGIYQDLIAACTPVSSSSGATSLGLNLIFGGKLYISGLSWVWKPQFSFNAENVPCPVNANVTSTSTQTSTSTTGTGAVNTTTTVSQTSTASTTVGQSSSQTGVTLSATSTASSTSAARTPTQTV
ncbi:hypothetical protein BGX21_002901 [Mortierella sp. AD011]|nr:hypothetical protein BGX20_008406 [Mortierella sp. AD010]KAF9401031.1 hypothetical protein BGX21_002901 [Mortierella sp. AD011]